MFGLKEILRIFNLTQGFFITCNNILEKIPRGSRDIKSFYSERWGVGAWLGWDKEV